MIRLDIRSQSRTKDPTATPGFARNPTPLKNPPTTYDFGSDSATLVLAKKQRMALQQLKKEIHE